MEHQVLKLWIRPLAGEAPVEVEALELETGSGVVGDHAYNTARHVTLVFLDDWKRATDELGQEVDPVGRRANILLSGGGGEQLPGRRVRLGEAVLEIRGITRPCGVMNEAAPGLQEALKPEARAGVWAKVLSGALIRPGDRLETGP
jgi:MOSC domain-containing protein YiiM